MDFSRTEVSEALEAQRYCSSAYLHVARGLGGEFTKEEAIIPSKATSD